MHKKIIQGVVLLSVILLFGYHVYSQAPGQPPGLSPASPSPGAAPDSATPTAPTARTPTPPRPQTAPTRAEVPEAPSEGAVLPLREEGVPTIGGEAPGGVKAEGAAPPAMGGEEQVYLNVQDADISDVIKQISKATSRNFIIDDKVKGKVTIISERPMTKEEAYQTFLSALEVAGFTVVKGPADVFRVVATNVAVSAPIPTHVDTTPYTASYITRLIPLQNISALDMSNAIKGLVSKNANMFAYPATNTLIITDSGANIDRLMKIIKELDQEGPQQVLEIIPVRNAAAKDIASLVNSLFEKKQAAARPARKGGELEEIEEVSKILPDDRTNSIIVLASKRAIDKVKEVIARLDSRIAAGDEGKIHVYYLKHAKAKELADTLSSLTSAAGKAATTVKAGAAAGEKKTTDIVVAEFEGGIKITADEATNALVVTSTPKDFKTLVDKVISKLDIPRRQVYLEAVIMELQVEKNKAYGMSGHGGKNIGGSLIGFGQTFQNAANLLSLFTSVGPTSPTILGGLIGSNTVNITVPSATGTGTQTISVPTMSALISAMQTYSDANVVSTPNILTLDNEEASIEVTREVAVAGQQTVTSAGIPIQGSPQYIPAGLKLKITPQIGEAGSVMLKIEQELSNFGPAPANALAPPKQSRKVSTSVVTKDGETVVLGGLMEDDIRSSKSKVPLLGDIPIIGFLFSRTEQQRGKRNLLIFITPHIVKDSTDFAEILKRKIDERNKFVDQNYGKKQRILIRDIIKSHNENLLEYTPQIPLEIEPPPIPSAARESGKVVKEKRVKAPPPDYGTVTESSAWKAIEQPPVTSETKTKAKSKAEKAKEAESIETPPSKPPVITVPSVDERSYQRRGNNSSSRAEPKKGKSKGELDMAY